MTVFRAGGSCVPPGELIAYTCAAAGPAAVPVVRVGERRFLGGPYAVRVPALPPVARELGASGSLAIYDAAADPSLVWMRRGARIDRLLALPATAGPRASFIGDSIMLGAKPEIQAALRPAWQVDVNAQVSRPTPDGLALVDADPAAYRDAVVIQLGANDGGQPDAYETHVDEILRALRASQLVMWLTTAEVRSYYTDDNRLMRSVLGRFPNAIVGDWNRVYPRGDVSSDGLHLGPTAALAMAHLTAGLLDGWRAAVAGRGADACGAAVTAG